MSYSAVSVANSIIKLAKERGIPDLSPMKLQKLLYFTQFWYVKNFNKFLINDYFSCWKYGPVIPSIYYELKTYQNSPVDSYIRQLSPNNEAVVYMMAEDDKDAWSLLSKVLDTYGKLDAIDLSVITHRPNSAWSKVSQGEAITMQNILDSDI